MNLITSWCGPTSHHRGGTERLRLVTKQRNIWPQVSQIASVQKTRFSSTPPQNVVKLHSVCVWVSPNSRLLCCDVCAASHWLHVEDWEGRSLGAKKKKTQALNCWFELYLQFALNCLAVALDNYTQCTFFSPRGHASSLQVRVCLYCTQVITVVTWQVRYQW